MTRNSSSFFFLTYAEIRALNWLKGLFSSWVSRKKNCSKKTEKNARIIDKFQIRALFKDQHFVTTMTVVETRALNAFSQVFFNFLGNKKANNYINLVKELLVSLQDLGCKKSIKVHYLHIHLCEFPANVGHVMRSKESVSIRMSKWWKNIIKVDGTVTWWQITVGVWWEMPLAQFIKDWQKKKNFWCHNWLHLC